MITRRKPIPKRRSKPRRGPKREPERLAWIREQHCILESTGECWGTIDASHIGPHGFWQKAADDSILPICRGHHRALHALGVHFWELHCIDPMKEVDRYREMYAANLPH